jgi:hypothetical protein
MQYTSQSPEKFQGAATVNRKKDRLKHMKPLPPPNQMYNAAGHIGCYAAPMPPTLLQVAQWQRFQSFIHSFIHSFIL